MDPTTAPPLVDWRAAQVTLEQAMLRSYPLLVGRAWRDAEAELGRPIPFNAALADRITAEIGKRAGGITETLRERIVGIVQQYQDNYPAAIRALQEAANLTEAKARELALTETRYAFNRGTAAAAKAAGANVYITDGNKDGGCASVNGSIQTADWLDANPLEHPNCLIAGIEVFAPHTEAAFSRRFNGEVVTLRTAANDFMTATVNHPILTAHGWVKAGGLKEGDYVIHARDSERIRRRLDPNNQYVPARIEQITHTPFMAGRMTTRIMPAAAEDFHGDGGGSKVYVERADCQLGDGVDTPSLQQSAQLSLLNTRRLITAGLLRLCRLDSFFNAWFSAACGSVGISGQSLSPLNSYTLQSESYRFAHSAVDSELAQPPANSSRLNTEVRTDHVRRPSLISIQSVERSIIRALVFGRGDARRSDHITRLVKGTNKRTITTRDSASKILDRLAGFIEPVQLTEVRYSDFAGHVFNLSTKPGWYFANSIITQNCTRRGVPTDDPLRDGEAG